MSILSKWADNGFKYFGNVKGSDKDYSTDQESFSNFQDTIDLLSSEKSGIEEDYTNAMEFAGAFGETERSGINRQFGEQRSQLTDQIGRQGFASTGMGDKRMDDMKRGFLDQTKMSILGQRQKETQAAKAQRESIFGLKSSMQEAYTSFLSNRLNLDAGNYDFNVEDQF